MAPFLSSWAGPYALIATLNIGICLFASGPVRPFFPVPTRAWWNMGIAALSSVVFIILPFLLAGTTLGALINMTVLQHIGRVKNWYFPTRFDALTLALTATSAILCTAFWWRRRSGEMVSLPQSNFGKDAPIVLRILLVAAAALPLRRGADFLFLYCTPFLWVFLLNGRPGVRHSRVVMAFIAAFTFLYAFPVAGAQVGFSSVPFAVIAIVVFQDACVGLLHSLPVRQVPKIQAWFRPLAFALVAGLLAVSTRRAYKEYTTNVALEMPGAEKSASPPRSETPITGLQEM